MNETQRKILLLAAVAMVAIGLYPPFYFIHNGSVYGAGHSFLFDPPIFRAPGRVDVGVVVAMWAAVLVIAAMLWVAFRDHRPQATARQEPEAPEARPVQPQQLPKLQAPKVEPATFRRREPIHEFKKPTRFR